MTINKHTLILGSLMFAGLVSCNADTDTESAVMDNATTEEVASPLQQPVPVPTPAAEVPAPTPALAINPAHGQPGHDCAVPVGAPLGGSAAAPTPAPTSITTAPPAPSPLGGPIPQFNANAANVNPAHGQPGHDCAVPVGAPLPSR